MKKKRIVAINNNLSLYTIKWRLTWWCNYRCSYCCQRRGTAAPNFDYTDFNRLLSLAPDVNRLIEAAPRGVKLSLLGGEVTWYDLEKLLAAIPSKNLKRLELTTNLSNSQDYYISLVNYLASRGIECDMACSWHSEHTGMEEFTQKVLAISKSAPFYFLKIETVIIPETEEKIPALKEWCEKNNISYLFEYDNKGKINCKNMHLNASCVSKPRYTVTFEDGSTDTTLSKNQIVTYGNEQATGTHFVSKGFYCTRGLTFAYINIDKVADHHCLPDEAFVPLKEYTFKTEPCRCSKETCNLDGAVNLAETKEALVF